MLQAIIQRLREPSTAAGVAALAVLAGRAHDEARAIADVVAGLAGLLAVVLPERRQ